MNKKYVDYIIYGVLGIVFIFSLTLIFSSDKGSTSNNANNKVVEELVLDTPNLTVKVGEEMELSAHVNNNTSAAITYLSLNTDVATINENHVVKGINTGRTYIMVRYHDNNGTDQIKHCSVDVLTNENYKIERISMADGEIVVKVGDSYKLEYQVIPESFNYKNEYLVTDSSIISVDKDGTIKGLKEGVAVIRIKVNDATLDKTVYVTNKEVTSGLAVLPSSITFKANSMKIKIDDEADVQYSYQPDNAELAKYSMWTSSDPEVVSVVDGKIKGLKEGVSNITLETANGMTISTKVTVSPKEIKATGIDVTSETSLTMNVGDVKDITYKVEPEDTTDKVTFSTSNSSVASVDKNGKITALAGGSATITIKAGTIKKNISVTVNNPSGSGSSGSSSSGSSSSGSSSGHCKVSSDPADEKYNSCFRYSHNLSLSVGGQDSTITMKVGETRSVRAYLPKECGTLIQYTRRSPDGGSGWRNYVSQSYSGVDSSGFNWVITAKKKGKVTISQTIQYDSKSPSGKCSGNVKSMIRLHIKIT